MKADDPGVLVVPGDTPLTVVPNWPTSLATDLVRPIRAALADA
jgi:hypothetical protein